VIAICNSSDRETWLAERRKGICASDAYACLTSPYAVYADKAEGVREQLDGEWLEWGHKLEPVIAAEFTARTGKKSQLDGTLCAHFEDSWIRATCDAFVLEDNDLFVPLEIKTAGAFAASEWEDGAPQKYIAQVQWQMLVTDAPHAYIACLIGGQKFVWQRIERDDEYIAHLRDAALSVWERVERLTPPPVDASAKSVRAFEMLHPKDNGETVELGHDALEDDTVLTFKKAKLDALDAEIKEIQTRMKTRIGDATFGLLPNGVSYSWKHQTRAASVTKASESRVLRRHEGKKK